MTKIEKMNVIRALIAYSGMMEKSEAEARRNGKHGLAVCYNKEKTMARANADVFREILNEPGNSVKI